MAGCSTRQAASKNPRAAADSPSTRPCSSSEFALGRELRRDRVDGQPEHHRLGPARGTSAAPCSASHTRASPPSSGVVEHLAQRGLGLRARPGTSACWQRSRRSGAPSSSPARGGQQLAVPRRAVRGRASHSSISAWAAACGESAIAVEQRVGALVGEVADGGRVDAGLQHPGPDRRTGRAGSGGPCRSGRRPRRRAGSGALAASLVAASAISASSTGWYSTSPSGSRSRNWSSSRIIASDTCSRTSSVGSPMSSGTIIDAASAGSGTGPVRRAALADGEQVEVAEHTVEEVGLGLRVPVRAASKSISPSSSRASTRSSRSGTVASASTVSRAPSQSAEDVLRAAAR